MKNITQSRKDVHRAASRWLWAGRSALHLILLAALCCWAGKARADDKQADQTQSTIYTEMKLLWGTKDVRVFADPAPSDCNRNYLFTVYPYQNFYLWSSNTKPYLDSIMYYRRWKILRNGQTWDSIGYPNGWYGNAYFWAQDPILTALDSPGNYEIIYEDYDAGYGWTEVQHAYFTCIPQITKVWIEAEEYCAPFETPPADNKIHFRIKTEPSIATVMHYAPRYETGAKSGTGDCLKEEEIKIGLDCKVKCPTLGFSYNVGSNFETVNNTYPNVFGAGINDVNGSLWGTYDTTQQYEFWANYTDAGSVAAGYGEIADYFNGSFQGEPLVVHLHITDGDLLDQTFDAPIIITFPKGTAPAAGLSAYHLGAYKLTQSETWTPEDNPVSKMYGTAHTTLKIRDSLDIPAGMQLTLRNVRLEFGPNGKVDVQTAPGSGNAGGYLLVDSSSTLTALQYCGDDTGWWQGIYVWGDATMNQGRFGLHNTGAGWQGVLEMRNNSEISYADWAVRNTGPVASTGAAAGKRNNRNGGIIEVHDSRFVNNVRAVNLERYPLPGIPITGTKPITYNASFYNTDFDVTVPLPTGFITGIAGWGVNGVGIAGCRFTNSITQAATFKSGLYGTDFGASVSDYVPYVGGAAIHSEFHDLDAGILLQNTGILPTTAVVTNSIFDGNYYGVSLSGLPAPQLHGNSFTIPQGHGDPDEALGVFINTGSGYGVSFNSFTRSPGTGQNTGVLISNTGGDENVVNSNTYNELWCANLSNYLNRSSDGGAGLQFLCNSNTGNTHDIAARGRWQSADGMKTNQGLPTRATRNTMSNTALFNIYNYTTEVQPINYYYGTGEFPSIVYGTNRIEATPSPCPYTNPNNDYPNNDNGHSSHGPASPANPWPRIAHFLQDPYCANRDSLDLALADWESPYGDLLRTDLLIADSSIDDANTIYDAIVSRYSLSGTEAVEFSTWGRRVMDLQITLRADGRTPDSLTTLEVQNLEGIADSAAMWARERARAILNLYDGRTFFTEKLFPDGDTTGGGGLRMVKTGSEYYRVSPNPIQESIQIHYSKENNADAVFMLTDAMGRTVKEVVLPGYAGTSIANATSLSAGLYFYRITENGTLKASGKLSKQ